MYDTNFPPKVLKKKPLLIRKKWYKTRYQEAKYTQFRAENKLISKVICKPISCKLRIIWTNKIFLWKWRRDRLQKNIEKWRLKTYLEDTKRTIRVIKPMFFSIYSFSKKFRLNLFYWFELRSNTKFRLLYVLWTAHRYFTKYNIKLPPELFVNSCTYSRHQSSTNQSTN